VQALEVRDLGRVSGFNQRFESGADQLGGAATEYGLLPEKIAFRLFAEAGLDDTGTERAKRRRISQCVPERFAARVLLDGDQRGHA